MFEGECWEVEALWGEASGPASGSELLENSLHSSKDSPWHHCREATARVSDRLNTGEKQGGREKKEKRKKKKVGKGEGVGRRERRGRKGEKKSV